MKLENGCQITKWWTRSLTNNLYLAWLATLWHLCIQAIIEKCQNRLIRNMVGWVWTEQGWSNPSDLLHRSLDNVTIFPSQLVIHGQTHLIQANYIMASYKTKDSELNHLVDAGQWPISKRQIDSITDHHSLPLLLHYLVNSSRKCPSCREPDSKTRE